MEDIKKKVDLTLSDLKFIQHRIQAMEKINQSSMSYLERATDNCWEYPNADEKHAELSKKMMKLEEIHNILSESSELITKVIISYRRRCKFILLR